MRTDVCIDVGGVLRTSLARRSEIIDSDRTTAFRALSGRAEGAPGLYVDVLGEAAIAKVYAGSPIGRAGSRALGEAILPHVEGLGARAVYVKRFGADRSRLGGAPAESLAPEPAAGVRTAETLPVLEDGRTLRVRPYDGLSTGVFVDQRANRRWLASRLGDAASAAGSAELRDGGAAAASVANLFAYTGAFGVAAACAAGGVVTSNVDVSDRYLRWAEGNYRANGLEVAAHHFPRMDARDFVAMASRKGWRFDAVVIDPPSFGARDRKKRVAAWSAERGYAGLVRVATGLLRRGGVCLCVTNTRSLCAPGALERCATTGLARMFRVVGLPEPDIDVALERGRTASCAFERV